MPKGPKGEKRPADVIGNAVKVMRIATGEEEDAQHSDSKDEAAVSLTYYQSAALAHAPEIAGYRPGPIGVFMGYDFHLSAEGL